MKSTSAGRSVSLLLVLLFAAAGFAIGRSAFSGSPPDAEPESTRTASPDPVVADRRTEPDESPAIGTVDPDPSAGRPGPEHLPESTVSIFDSEDSKPWPDSIEGRVVDLELRPIPDVLIRARSSGNASFEARTDEDGSFVIDGLPDARVTIEAEHAAYRIALQGPETQHPGQFLHFLAHPLFDVEFDLVGPDGTVPEEAWLSVIELGSRRLLHWTRSSRRLPMPADGAQVRALARPIQPFGSDDYRKPYAWRSELQWISRYELGRDQPDRVPTARFTMAPVPALVVHLADDSPGGRPKVDEVGIRLTAFDQQSRRPVLEQKRRPRGPWLFYDIAPGAYDLEPFWSRANSGARLGPASSVEVGTGLTVSTTRVEGPRPGDWIRLDVSDPLGRPAAIGQLRIESVIGGGMNLRTSDRILDFDSAQLLPWSEIYRNLGRRPRDLGNSERETVLTVTHPVLGRGRALVTGEAGADEQTARIVLKRLGTLEVTPSPWPEGPNGPLPLVVNVYEPNLIDSTHREQRVTHGTRRDPGPITVREVPEGPIRVEVVARSTQRRTLPFAQVELLSTPPITAVTVDLPQTYGLIVECPGLEPGTVLQAIEFGSFGFGTERLAARARTSSEGIATFAGLVASEYEIRVPGTATAIRVTIPSGPIRIE